MIVSLDLLEPFKHFIRSFAPTAELIEPVRELPSGELFRLMIGTTFIACMKEEASFRVVSTNAELLEAISKAWTSMLEVAHKEVKDSLTPADSDLESEQEYE